MNDENMQLIMQRFDTIDKKVRKLWMKKFEAKFEAMDEKFEAKFEAMDKKFEAKFDSMDKKNSRYWTRYS